MATFKRGAFIEATLRTILPQLTDDVELVVVDGASPDCTPDVVGRLIVEGAPIRYFREPVNSGIDGDYDKAVGYARGEHCWLMPDDDWLRPNAIARVLEAVARGPELVVVNAEVRDATMRRVLNPSLLACRDDHGWGQGDTDALFRETAGYLSFIGGVVIRRDRWMARERARYHGSLFIHMGVIFQTPPLERVWVIAEPLIVIRYGNAMWTPRSFEIWMFLWPDLVWSFTSVGEAARSHVVAREPWRSPRVLLYYRAIGAYGPEAFERFLASRLRGLERWRARLIAALPLPLANLVAVGWLLTRGDRALQNLVDLLAVPSAHASRLLARLVGRAG